MAQDIHPNNRWHSIRPWTPRLSLSVRELTSVSATFILSSLSAHTNLSLILDGDDAHSDDEDDGTGDTSTGQPVASGSRSQRIISDALSKGLSVTVNGAPWQRVLIRVDDEADEAVIIIYGLMPGRQYDIELGVIPGEERVKGQITTESQHGDTSADHADRVPSSSSLPTSPPSRPPSPTPSISTNHQPLHTAQPTAQPTIPQTIEEYIAVLNSNLATLQSENATLLGTLKQTRRDAQKSSSALRSDITSLKKASQKHSTADARARQKVRALEEAMKQAARGKEEVEEETVGVEAERKEKEEELAIVEARCNGVRDRAAEWRAKREKAEADLVARLAPGKAELASLDAKVEKLRARKEKLAGQVPTELDEFGSSSNDEAEDTKDEKEVSYGNEEDSAPSQDSATLGSGLVGELEDKLRELQLEREQIEADPYGYVASSHPNLDDDAIIPSEQSLPDLASGFSNAPIPMPISMPPSTSNINNVAFLHNPRLQPPHAPFNPVPRPGLHAFGLSPPHTVHQHPHAPPHLQHRVPPMLNKRHIPFIPLHHTQHHHHPRHSLNNVNTNGFNINPAMNPMLNPPNLVNSSGNGAGVGVGSIGNVNAIQPPRPIGPVQRPHPPPSMHPIGLSGQRLPGMPVPNANISNTNPTKQSPPLSMSTANPQVGSSMSGLSSSSSLTGPPGLGGSTLSGLAPPFEPASVRSIGPGQQQQQGQGQGQQMDGPWQ